MKEEGHGGGDLVEFFELHEIVSRPTFRPPPEREKDRTYFAGVLGVGLRYRRHDELMMRARSGGSLSVS
jgi:hypothetical protein